MCLSILSACIPVFHVYTVPVEGRRGCQILWNGSHRLLWSLCVSWNPNLNPLEEQREVLQLLSHLSCLISLCYWITNWLERFLSSILWMWWSMTMWKKLTLKTWAWFVLLWSKTWGLLSRSISFCLKSKINFFFHR